jgi:DNA-binding transcriptional LysR family regulator
MKPDPASIADFAQTGLTFDQLRTFQAVATAGSVTRAAQMLYLTQPAVSQRIDRLERSLGVKLFDHGSHAREFRLTVAGRRVLHFADGIMSSLRELRGDLEDGDSAPVTRRIVIAAPHTVMLSALVSAFRARNPGVQVEIRLCDGKALNDVVRRGEAELGVQISHWADERFRRIPILEDRLVLVRQCDERVAGEPEAALEQVMQTPFVLPPPSSYFRHATDEWAASLGIRIKVALESPSFGVIIRAVLHRFGIAVIPERMVYRQLSRGDLCAVPVQGLPRTYEVCVIADGTRPLSAATRAMLKLAQERAWRTGMPAELWSLAAPPPKARATA